MYWCISKAFIWSIWKLTTTKATTTTRTTTKEKKRKNSWREQYIHSGYMCICPWLPHLHMSDWFSENLTISLLRSKLYRFKTYGLLIFLQANNVNFHSNKRKQLSKIMNWNKHKIEDLSHVFCLWLILIYSKLFGWKKELQNWMELWRSA